MENLKSMISNINWTDVEKVIVDVTETLEGSSVSSAHSIAAILVILFNLLQKLESDQIIGSSYVELFKIIETILIDSNLIKTKTK